MSVAERLELALAKAEVEQLRDRERGLMEECSRLCTIVARLRGLAYDAIGHLPINSGGRAGMIAEMRSSELGAGVGYTEDVAIAPLQPHSTTKRCGCSSETGNCNTFFAGLPCDCDCHKQSQSSLRAEVEQRIADYKYVLAEHDKIQAEADRLREALGAKERECEELRRRHAGILEDATSNQCAKAKAMKENERLESRVRELTGAIKAWAAADREWNRGGGGYEHPEGSGEALYEAENKLRALLASPAPEAPACTCGEYFEVRAGHAPGCPWGESMRFIKTVPAPERGA